MLLAFSCGLCSEETSDQEQIRRIIARAVELAEKQDIGGIMDLASQDFVAMPGNRGRRETKGMLFYVFRRYPDLSILYPRPGVTVEPGATDGTASVVFLLLRGSDARPDLDGLGDDLEKWIETAGDYTRLYRLKLSFSKEDGDWLVRRARLERFKGLGFGQ